ncbi:Ferredoxin C 2, chloroplastic-like protein [Drosera capensis]
MTPSPRTYPFTYQTSSQSLRLNSTPPSTRPSQPRPRNLSPRTSRRPRLRCWLLPPSATSFPSLPLAVLVVASKSRRRFRKDRAFQIKHEKKGLSEKIGTKSALGHTAKEMELLQPLCNFRTPLQLCPPFPGWFQPPRNFLSTCAFSYPNNSPKHKPPRPTAIAKLQTPALDTALTGPSSIYASQLTHKVTVHDRQHGLTHEFLVPEDQYILHTAEDQNIALPFACRHGCCTSCAVRIKSGEIRQPEALGISAELKSKACESVSTLQHTSTPYVLVYWLQFGRYFARGPIERDDYAFELAMGDE